MGNRSLLVAMLLVPGILIGIWIGPGSGQGTAPPRLPGDAVQQAQSTQAVPSTRPEQQKTPRSSSSGPMAVEAPVLERIHSEAMDNGRSEPAFSHAPSASP